MNSWEYIGTGLIVLGALMASGVLALLPQCGFGINLIVTNACLLPITVFGLNPNLVAGVVLIGVGAFFFVKSRMEPES